MLKTLSHDARTVLISIVAASVVAGPSAAAAAYVANADKVDNKHAVGFGATATDRKGKLVATNGTTGLLPNNIIAKALDADLLDGVDSAAFQRRVSGACGAGTAVTGVLADGQVSCSTAFLPSSGKAADSAKLDGKTLDGVRSRGRRHGTTGNQTLTGTATSLSSITVNAPTAGTVVVSGLAGLYADKPSGSGGVYAHITVNSLSNTSRGARRRRILGGFPPPRPAARTTTQCPSPGRSPVRAR